MSRFISVTRDVLAIVRWYDVLAFLVGVAVAAYGFVRMTLGHWDGMIGVILGGVIIGLTVVIYREVVRVRLTMAEILRADRDTAQ